LKLFVQVEYTLSAQIHISAMADLPVEHSESSGFDSWLRDWLPHWCLCATLLSTFSWP